MNIPHKNKASQYSAGLAKKNDEREVWHKLVVKIISWKDGSFDGRAVRSATKITPKEWGIYSKRMIQINTTYGRQKVVSNLKETREMIRKHGGFEADLSGHMG